jgi:iron(III) transport system permease protein
LPVSATAPARSRPGAPAFDGDRALLALLLAGAAVPLLVFVVWPLAEILKLSFDTPKGIGLGNYAVYFATPKFARVLVNSLRVALCATLVTTVLAYAFAYAMQRCLPRGQRVLGAIALLPLYAPSLLQALGILFLLGRNGAIARIFGIDIDIYGFTGIVLADVFYAFPHAYLILSAALAIGDARLYESAEMLGAGRTRIFRTVTLPATRYGLMSAVFVVFTIVITDFGNPMVIGGDYSVLATEIYNQVSGQGNMAMGAVIGVVLLVPAAIAVFVERWVARHHHAALGDRSDPLRVVPSPARDRVALAYCALVCGAIALIVLVVVVASFVKLWPYNLEASLRHYHFEVQNGLAPLWTSIGVSLAAAGLGIVVVIVGAAVVRRLGPVLTQALYFLSVLPAAVPGMVLGLGYILAFNRPDNPLGFLYGSLAILVICNVYHYHAQGFLIATTAMNQVSHVFDEASTCLGGGLARTLRTVTLPLVAPALVSIGVFFFVRSMVTLSAVIFIVTPATQLAAVSVLLLDDSGNQNQAAAYSVCIMAVVAVALVALEATLALVRRRGGVREPQPAAA